MIKHIQKITRSNLARNAGWMFAGQGVSFIVQGLYFVLLARILGSLQYGLLAGSAALVTVASQYSTMGSGLLFLRYVSPDYDRRREYWGNILISTVVFGSAIVLSLWAAGSWMLRAHSSLILVLLAIGECFCGQLSVAAGQVFQTFEKMRITATLNLITNLSRMILAIVMLLTIHRATALEWAVASLGISVLAVSTALVAVTSCIGCPIFHPRLWLSRLQEGFVFAVTGSTTSIYNDLDKVMLGHFGMTVANGIYTMAYRVVNIATVPIMSIQAAAFPRFFREGVAGLNATEPFARRILKRTVLLGAGVALASAFLAPVIPHLVGIGFSQTVSALRWLCLIPLFRALHVGAGDAMAGAGYQRFRFASQALAASLNFGMNLYLIPRYSWWGAAVASLITDGSLAIISWTVLYRLKAREAQRYPRGLAVPVSAQSNI